VVDGVWNGGVSAMGGEGRGRTSRREAFVSPPCSWAEKRVVSLPKPFAHRRSDCRSGLDIARRDIFVIVIPPHATS